MDARKTATDRRPATWRGLLGVLAALVASACMAIPEHVPPAPTGVSAQPGDGQVTVTWNAVSGAASYNLYWSTTSGLTPSNGNKITGATSPYVHTGLTNGTTYYYVVTAVNAGGESGASSQVSAKPQVLAPGAPTGVSATPGDAQVTVTWSAPTSGGTPTSYNLYWNTTSGVTPSTGSKIAGVTSPYVHSGLTNGTTYYYVVTAVNAGVESGPSNQVSAKPHVPAPGSPTGVSGTPGDAQVTVTWSAPTSGGTPTSYNLYWSTTSGVTPSTGTKIAGVTSPYMHSGLANGTAYYYVVTAVNAGGESGASGEVSAVPGLWTWVSGSSTVNATGIYGKKGVAAAGNVPGARDGAISWVDASGNLWLFGGYGFDSAGTEDYLNDLWKFDGTAWTWVSGSNAVDDLGSYGAKGVPAPGNVPRARERAISWIDKSGNLWLFGGYGWDSTNNTGPYYLDDLWKFDPVSGYWTWVSGSATENQSGVYGTKDVASSGNLPGGRDGAVSWIDGSDNLWLFGGYGFDSAGNHAELNDLWKFDGTDWTWVSGSDTYGALDVYGIQGVASATNVPGARQSAVSWIDSSVPSEEFSHKSERLWRG